jgi:hypothetical protein
MPFSRNSRVALIAAITLVPVAWTAHLATVNAQTQIQCDSADVFKRLPALPDGCQRERINGSGGMRPTENLARGSAEKEWKREVVTKYGERFQNWANAVCKRSECVPAAIGGLTRCSVSAIPCAKKPTFEGSGSAAVALSSDEVKEVQRLLKVKADGNWGSGSTAALEKWQAAKKLPVTGIPTKDILEQLRKG